MCGTRSPSRREQAIEALIVAHGQPSDPWPAELALREIANDAARILPQWNIGSATLAGPGELERALKQMTAEPFVYPFFMSDGWISETALPARLGLSRSRILAPFGLSPQLPAATAHYLSAIARQRGWKPEMTEIVVAGHGSASGRENPARCTRRFAHALSLLSPWLRVHVGFVQQEPRLSSVAATCGPQSICVPFFAADGYHVCFDVPESLRTGGFMGVTCPPVGRAAFVPDLIADALQKATVEVAA